MYEAEHDMLYAVTFVPDPVPKMLVATGVWDLGHQILLTIKHMYLNTFRPPTRLKAVFINSDDDGNGTGTFVLDNDQTVVVQFRQADIHEIESVSSAATGDAV